MKNSKTKKNIKKQNRKTKKNMRGGFLTNQSITLPGLGAFSKQTGSKVYNATNNEWKDQRCYTIFGFKFCL